MNISDIKEGYIPVSGGRVWFQIVGSSDAVPLLTLHGGPGAGHDNLESLTPLSSERPVIFYDQLGCGKSDQPNDVSLWHIERYVEEIEDIRKTLGLKRIHLYGQSWGGWVALEYALAKPEGLASVILGSTAASMRQFGEELDRLRAQLPTGLQETLRKYEAVGDYHNSEYQNAYFQFLGPLFCRIEPFPEVLMRTMEIFNRNTIPYETIWGPNEYVMNGNLKDWDRSARLGEISIPTLVLCGRYDEITPACSETIHHGIPNSEIHIFENSAHMAHLEEAEEYVRVMREFMRRAE
jgi:proline-specific peptidase